MREYGTVLEMFYSTRDVVLGDSCNGWTASGDHYTRYEAGIAVQSSSVESSKHADAEET
jgi:hypothetical protein